MSDFVPRDILPDLWEEILQRHWTFLETEESMQKLEERKKLEGCLKEFLYIVPHDRKFFLPETAHVLKKSIKEMDDFSAYKAMIGFESISQYANNLFTKPWRKEYRTIKMYSGFYQHEIRSNLVGADKLFEAMGYRQLPNQILMLEGPICPDQVTNVSRDAMAAYVECQIMKQIFTGLTSLQLSCSWLDVFNYRETHIGGASQAVKSLAYSMQERRFRKEKLNSETCYATIQHPQQQMLSSCPTCVHACHSQIAQMGTSCGIHHVAQQPQNYSAICGLHSQPTQNMYMHNNVPVPLHYKSQGYGHSQMSHSKSLEHYAEHAVPSGALPHRHSFDQPYDNSYDCVENYQSCNFSAYNHPYNVSGNRYPLPYNISAQLNNQFSNCAGTGHYQGSVAPPQIPASMGNCGHKLAMQPDQIYGDCNGFVKKTQDPSNYHSANNKDLMNYRQCGCGSSSRSNNMNTDQLIDFDDRPNDHCVSGSHNRSHNNSFDCNDRTMYDQSSRSGKMKQSQYDVPRTHHNITNLTPKDLYSRNVNSSDEIDGNYLYTNGRADKKMPAKRFVEKYTHNAEILEQYEKIIDNNETKGAHDSFDSFEDILAVDGSDSTQSKSVSNKNQDGVGSFESWDYVFQNLEKHGYTKDLGERGDLLVQGLDLDSMKLSGGTEKRRSRNLENKLRAPSENVKSKTLEKTDFAKETNGSKIKSGEKITPKPDDEHTHRPALKTTQIQKSLSQLQPTLKSGKSLNNNYDETQNTEKRAPNRPSPATVRTSASGAVSSQHKVTSTGPNSNNGRSTTTSNMSTIIASSPNEWSCRFCTYLNPDTKRICEMCCRSKDFNPDATNPTCV